MGIPMLTWLSESGYRDYGVQILCNPPHQVNARDLEAMAINGERGRKTYTLHTSLH